MDPGVYAVRIPQSDFVGAEPTRTMFFTSVTRVKGLGHQIRRLSKAMGQLVVQVMGPAVVPGPPTYNAPPPSQ